MIVIKPVSQMETGWEAEATDLPMVTQQGLHVPAPEKTMGWEPSPPPAQNVPSPSPAARPAERASHPILALSLPRETGCTWHCFPEGHGRQEPGHVSGCVWDLRSHCSSHQTTAREGGLGALRTQLAARLLGERGRLSLSPASGKWAHGGLCPQGGFCGETRGTRAGRRVGCWGS